MSKPLRVLVVEDSEDDTLLMVRELERGGYDPVFERVETAEAMTAALAKQTWDVVLADYNMPHFSALEALELLKESGVDLPFIVVSGSIGEDVAVATMKAGAHDYLMKDNLKRLVPAVERELREAEVRKEHKQAEEALHQSEEKYSMLVERGNDGIIIVQDGVLTFVNSKMIEMTGFSLEEILGKSFVDFVSPEYRELIVDRYRRRISGEEVPSKYEVEILVKDGRKISVEISASMIEHEGRPADMAIVRDITKRKRAEETLRESQERYRGLFEKTHDMIQSVAPDGHFIFVNRAWLETLGYTEVELPGLNLFKIIHPESLAHCQELFAEVMHGESVQNIQATFVAKDGRSILVEGNAIGRYIGDKMVSTQGIFRNITERKKAEEEIKQAAEEWRTTFDSITDFVSICDKDFRLVRVNKAFADVCKMKPKELIGKPCYEVFHGTNEPISNCPHEKTMRTKKPAMVEFFEPHLGIHLEVSTSPIFNKKGEVVASVHVARDITKRKQMEEQLIVTDRLASVGELASGIAHELNNPLTGVIGFSQLLLDKDIPDDVKEDVKIIYSEAQRTAQVVKNLLTFARKHEPVKQMVNINSIIEKVLELRAYEQRVSNIQANTRFAPDLPEVMADYFQLQQVFLNIIINAEHFMIEEHGRGTLTITTERTEDIITASFADDGPGISKGNLGHLFDPFFTTKEVGKGTGLGLSICHGIITEHGGRIYVESELGKGATFIVELPITEH